MSLVIQQSIPPSPFSRTCPFPLLYAVADARLVEDVGGVVGVVAQLAAELLRGGAHPTRVARAPQAPGMVPGIRYRRAASGVVHWPEDGKAVKLSLVLAGPIGVTELAEPKGLTRS